MSHPMRMTPQRATVLRVVRQSHDHPTATEIFERAKEAMPYLSNGTVYNTLAALAQQGEILEVSGGKASRYDGRNDRHDHALCLQCGSLLDVDTPLPEAFTASASRQTGFQITSHHTEYYGYCPTCASALTDRPTDPSQSTP